MDREKFISILTEGYEFDNLSLENISLLRMMLIRLINDSDDEIWATIVKTTASNAEPSNDEQILISVDSFSLLYLEFVENHLMFFLYDEEDVSMQIQRIANAVHLIVESVQELEDYLLNEEYGYEKLENQGEVDQEMNVYQFLSSKVDREILNNLEVAPISNLSKAYKKKKMTKGKRVYTSGSKSGYQRKNIKMNQHHYQILDSYLSKNEIFEHVVFRSKFEEV
jgi:hypothetical protein